MQCDKKTSFLVHTGRQNLDCINHTVMALIYSCVIAHISDFCILLVNHCNFFHIPKECCNQIPTGSFPNGRNRCSGPACHSLQVKHAITGLPKKKYQEKRRPPWTHTIGDVDLDTFVQLPGNGCLKKDAKVAKCRNINLRKTWKRAKPK